MRKLLILKAITTIAMDISNWLNWLCLCDIVADIFHIRSNTLKIIKIILFQKLFNSGGFFSN